MTKGQAHRMMSLETDAGRLTVVRATVADYDAVMAILREAAGWLSGRGIHQWDHWYMDAGEQILRDRLEHDEVYLFQRDSFPVGTLTIQRSDTEVWGERGIDGQAGYIHGMAIVRSAAGKRVGERMLEWAIGTIAARGLSYARLDAMASNAALCSYYEHLGFRPLGTETLFSGIYTARLFERELRHSKLKGVGESQ
jgi:ribosomal protein S18 acetylase RimI-like enzyme